MGYYLNSKMPITFFEKERNKRYFVDKSRLLADLIPVVKEGLSYICITRPRRFGKTMMANMVGAFFGKGYDSSDIFDSLEIADNPFYHEHLNRHDVIYIDFSKCNEGCQNYQDYITDIKEILREDLHEAFPDVKFRSKGTVNEDLARIFNDTGTRFVFVFDEWDYIFHRDYITETDKKNYINFLAVGIAYDFRTGEHHCRIEEVLI
ncbi:MAG: AAA family ATPase [Clostridiales bacterium]|nr:AAA family ATPase [Clostridiales bacterium]